MGAEHDVRPLRNFGDVVDEDRTLRLEGGDDMDVVNDLLAHVHRGTEALEGLLNRDHGPIHSCTVAPGRSKQHALGGSHGVVP